MAILKQAKNLKVKIKNCDTIISGKYTQVAESIIVESLEKDMSLSSVRKIISTGNTSYYQKK